MSIRREKPVSPPKVRLHLIGIHIFCHIYVPCCHELHFLYAFLRKKDSSALLKFLTPNICTGMCQQEVRANLLAHAASWWEVHISRLIAD